MNKLSVPLPQWFVYKTFSIWHLVGIADAEWQEPFTAGGLVWWVTSCASPPLLHQPLPAALPLSLPSFLIRRTRHPPACCYPPKRCLPHSTAVPGCSGNLRAAAVRTTCIRCPTHLDATP